MCAVKSCGCARCGGSGGAQGGCERQGASSAPESSQIIALPPPTATALAHPEPVCLHAAHSAAAELLLEGACQRRPGSPLLLELLRAQLRLRHQADRGRGGRGRWCRRLRHAIAAAQASQKVLQPCQAARWRCRCRGWGRGARAAPHQPCQQVTWCRRWRCCCPHAAAAGAAAQRHEIVQAAKAGGSGGCGRGPCAGGGLAAVCEIQQAGLRLVQGAGAVWLSRL